MAVQPAVGWFVLDLRYRLGCPLLKILMNNLLVGVICFISTLYINWQVNMVIIGVGIFSTLRVYFKYFLTKTYLNMCSDMLFYPNAFSCEILAFSSERLLIEKHIRNIIPKFGYR